MTIVRLLYLICSSAAAVSALVASIYWYLSSRPAPQFTESPTASISDNPELHILGAQVDIYSIQAALSEAALLNKKAALWSAVSALLGALTFALPLLIR
jgi:hypothetical protein